MSITSKAVAPVSKPQMKSYPGNEVRNYDLDTAGLSEVSFGKDIRKEFGLKPDFVFLNHGSYGTVPNRVMELQYRYNQEREAHPEAWFRMNASQYIDKSRTEIASKINATVDNVVLVDNATTAVNCTLRAFPFLPGDALLDTTHTYGAIQNLCTDFTSRMRPDIERINLCIKPPITSEEDVLAAYENALNEHPNIKVAIIDHITSPTSVLMPVERLCTLCHSKGVTVIIDGAHAFGQLALDMKAIGADVYVSNIHKWSYSPRGAALLWFSEKNRSWIRPPNTSWLMLESLHRQFFDQGTRDHVPAICARHGIQFYDAIGGMDKIVKYTTQLANEGKQLLQNLGLTPLAIPVSMEAPNLKLLKLPAMAKYPYSVENTWNLHRDMFGGTNIFGIITPFDGAFWIRISTQVYNDIDDLKAFADLLKSFLDKNKD